MNNGLQEEMSQNFLALAGELLPKKPIICDVGSRDGSEAISLFEQLDGGGLHVFEPNPSAAEICRINLASLLKHQRAICSFNELAVSDIVGHLKFYPVNAALSENKDIGFSSLLPINPEYTKRRGRIVQDEVIVQSITLDQYFAGKLPPDLLWIDVEGAELKVLRGAVKLLPQVRLIHIEVSFRPMQIGKPLFWEIERYLVALGFRFYGFVEVPTFIGFLYRHRLLPNLPWRLNAVFHRAS